MSSLARIEGSRARRETRQIFVVPRFLKPLHFYLRLPVQASISEECEQLTERTVEG